MGKTKKLFSETGQPVFQVKAVRTTTGMRVTGVIHDTMRQAFADRFGPPDGRNPVPITDGGRRSTSFLTMIATDWSVSVDKYCRKQSPTSKLHDFSWKWDIPISVSQAEALLQEWRKEAKIAWQDHAVPIELELSMTTRSVLSDL